MRAGSSETVLILLKSFILGMFQIISESFSALSLLSHRATEFGVNYISLVLHERANDNLILIML